MPRIDAVQVWRWLYVAFTVNDYGQFDDVAVRLSWDAARDACFEKHCRRIGGKP